jgi:hypothetical protein
MTHCYALFVQVLDLYAENVGDNLHTVLSDLRIAVDPITAAKRVEYLAEATWQAVARRGIDLPPARQVYFLARPFDDGEARLIVLAAHHIVYNDVWITAGKLSDWERCVEGLATTIEHSAAASVLS